MDFMPRQSLKIQLLHEGVGVEVLDIPHAGLLPDALDEHHRTNHGRHAGGVGNTLRRNGHIFWKV